MKPPVIWAPGSGGKPPETLLRLACRQALDADEFVEGMKKRGIRVPGIGHRIKSKDNRDKRVELLQNYARRCTAAVLVL